MATWELTTEWKKSSVERQFWFKDDKVIIREEGYRWATFTIESDVRPLTDEELRNEDGYELGFCDAADESWEMVEMNDGCWAETEAGRNCTDEDLEAFEEAWDENYYEGVEELGWQQDDTEYFFSSGPLKLTNTDTGEEFSGSIDPTTVVHTIDLSDAVVETIEVAPELAPIVEGAHWPTPNSNFVETAKWPFERPQEGPKVEEVELPDLTDWYPAVVCPARNGSYEVLARDSDSWPFPQFAEWDGDKWSMQGVTYWRGLSQDPNAQ